MLKLLFYNKFAFACSDNNIFQFCNFGVIKIKLLYLFLIFAGILYLTSVLELDSNECKQNFKNEQQHCIVSEKTADTLNFHFDNTLSSAFAFTDFSFHYALSTKLVQPLFHAHGNSSDKTFLRHRAILI